VTKQDIVREIIAWKLVEVSKRDAGIPFDVKNTMYWFYAGELMEKLKSQGVAIKVDRELPKHKYPHTEIDAYIWEAQTEMLLKGYTAWEEL